MIRRRRRDTLTDRRMLGPFGPDPEVPDRRRWNVLAVGLLVVYGVGLIVFAAAAVVHHALRVPVLAEYTRPTAWWPILVQGLLGVGAFTAYYWPRRREHRRAFSLVLTTGMALTTIVLGFTSYVRCPAGGQNPFWAAVTWTLDLIFAAETTCQLGENGYPLALQMARLLGPLLVLVAGLGIIGRVFQAQNDRLRIRFASALVVIVGLAEDSIGLLRRLATDTGGRVTLAVLVDDAESPLAKVARDIGARVAVCDVDDRPTLHNLMTSRARFAVRALYAVGSDVSVNLRWAAQFRDLADATKHAGSDMPPRMIVRIDDPWQAEYWRRTNAYRTGADRPLTDRPVSADSAGVARKGGKQSVRWMSDSLSVYEVTATLILERVLNRGFDQLVLVGSSALALAVCAELAQREREGELLADEPQPSFDRLVLFGPGSAELREQHRLRQERFGNVTGSGPIRTVSDEPSSDSLRRVIKDARRPVVILADDPSTVAVPSATFLAALNPEWTIFAWDTRTRGVAQQPIMERLYPFGLTTESPPGWPVDSWERAARVVHENYRIMHVPEPDPNVPSHRAWDLGLDPFLKESNVRLVTTTLAAAESAGRSWGPVSPAEAKSATPLPAEQLEVMAEQEHSSWLKHHLDNGWRYGATRNDAQKVHPAMLAWNQLDPVNKEKTRQNVLAALTTLEVLGYRSSPAGTQADSEDWIRVARRGEVTAVRVDEAWTWTNRAGEVLQAKAGDWRVSDGEGQVWSVDAEIFARTYEPIEGDRWRRVGDIDARPAVAGELVVSLEGPEIAGDGDWVMRGARGELWITDADYFTKNYTRE